MIKHCFLFVFKCSSFGITQRKDEKIKVNTSLRGYFTRTELQLQITTTGWTSIKTTARLNFWLKLEKNLYLEYFCTEDLFVMNKSHIHVKISTFMDKILSICYSKRSYFSTKLFEFQVFPPMFTFNKRIKLSAKHRGKFLTRVYLNLKGKQTS